MKEEDLRGGNAATREAQECDDAICVCILAGLQTVSAASAELSSPWIHEHHSRGA
jgi:hypothetical protein